MTFVNRIYDLKDIFTFLTIIRLKYFFTKLLLLLVHHIIIKYLHNTGITIISKLIIMKGSEIYNNRIISRIFANV